MEKITDKTGRIAFIGGGMMAEAMEEAESHGVHVYRDIDKTAFIEAVQPIHANFYNKGEAYKKLYDDIQKYAD